MTALPSGDLVVACADRNGIVIIAFEGADGRSSHYRARAPDCGHTPDVAAALRPRVHLATLPNGKLALAGAAGTKAGKCSWLAVFSLPAP